MEPPTRIFTAARIVALALIRLAVLGLAYLGFAPGAKSVSVAKGAHAGDLVLKPCSYGTENDGRISGPKTKRRKESCTR